MERASYDNYHEWKKWEDGAFFSPTPREQAYFDAEFRRIPIARRHVLEIGFGNGTFLRWAKDRCATVAGTEVSQEALARAAAIGVEILPADLSQAAASNIGRFDLIVALDVIEHLKIAEIGGMFDMVAQLLKPGGVFLARFPNGQSPFGRIYQYGDLTHQTVMSAAMIEQLIADRPLRMVRAGNPATPIFGAFPRRAAQFARRLSAAVLERCLRSIYGLDCPLGPNVVVVLERSPSSSRRVVHGT